MKQIGLIQWYSSEKGYGLISTVDSTIDIQSDQDKSITKQKYNEVFIHIKNWSDKSTIDFESNPLPLIFDVIFERGKITAKQCRYFNYSVEDFELLYELSVQHHGIFAITVKPNNNPTRLVDLIFKQNHVSLTHFDTVLRNKLSQVNNDDFFNFIETLYQYFGRDNVTKEIIQISASVRAKETSNNSFIFELWEKEFLNTNDLTLEVIKNNIPKVNVTLFKKLISHPDIINIYQDLLAQNNLKLVYKLINHGMAKSSLIEYAVMKAKSIISEVETKNIIAEVSRLLNALDNKSLISEIVNKEIAIRLKESDDSIFIFDSWEAGYIETSKLKLIDIENNIEKITLDLFNKLKSHPDIHNIIWFILSYSKEQKLLENIICDLENIQEGKFDFKQIFHIIHNNLLNYSVKNQVLFMKKLFHLHSLSRLEFTAEDMRVFLSDDVINAINNHDQIIDDSTLLIANILYNFQINGKFIAEKELIKTVLNSIGNDKSRKIKIDHYFDKCEGVTRPRISDRSNGTITKEKFFTSNGEEKYYFKVAFDYSKDIVEAIKKIPGSKYNSDAKYWGVPLQYNEELIAFAKEYMFTIESENKFQENAHLLKWGKIPTDIAFCSGVEAKVPDSDTGKKFWWCDGGRCYENNIHLHGTKDWQKYTLYDFVNILGLSLEEDTSVVPVANGLYIQFVTILNRFKNLLDKMYCTECEHVLYPVETSIASAYSVVKYTCVNKQCGLHQKVIYLNHCLNGHCHAIIDSRESKKCSNGLFICLTCGSCCSHAMFERRRKNLSENGVSIPTDLMQKIRDKSGHLEKTEYFCYKCGQWMLEYSDVSYKCKDCDVHYDLKKYPYLKTIRTNIEFRDINYPKVSFNNITSKLKAVLLNEKQSLESQGRSKSHIFGILYNKEVVIDGNKVSLKLLSDKKLTSEIFA